MTTKHFCIRCCPASELDDVESGLHCRYHGKNYILESRAVEEKGGVEVIEEVVADESGDIPAEIVTDEAQMTEEDHGNDQTV
jgi:hypothetical protein